MIRVKQVAARLSVAAVSLATFSDRAAADPADFYRAKNLDLVISSSVGGG